MRQLLTKWGRELDEKNVLPEYPRELLRRKNWTNLNGYWDYAFTGCMDRDNLLPQGIPEKWDGQILVPFSPESVLSKVNRQLAPDELLWYRRLLPPDVCREGKKVLLHFGAVDQACVVYVNGKEAGRHIGGFLPFDLDITDFLLPPAGMRGETDAEAYDEECDEAYGDELVVCVRDVSDTSWHARGKQKLKNGGMFYTAVSGIWQTVWMEEVPESYILGIETVPDPDNCSVDILVKADADIPVRVNVRNPELFCGSGETCREDGLFRGAFVVGQTNRWLNIKITRPKLWTCREPWIYPFDVDMGEDHASSYFAMRKISVENDGKGIPRICLNHEPVYLRGVLDQGYWPDGIYTPPSEEAILFDLREMKKSGFQMVRKHAKIEPDRWYYHCDRLGLLVWQDIVNGGEAYKSWYVAYAATLMNWLGIRPGRVHPGHVGRLNEAGKEEFCREIAQTAAVLREHPCMFAWTLFNEGWGQFETDRCVRILQKADPEHLIDAASGWFDQRGGDFRSVHFYYLTFRVAAEKKRAFVLSEFGGLPYHIPGHSNGERIYGYGAKSRTKEQLNRKYQKLMKNIERNIPKGLCATVYTQWTDIEDEVNGIYTCDREIRKIYNFREREKGLKLSEELQNEKEFPETENGGSKHAIDI